MKKIFALVLCAALALSLAACGNKPAAESTAPSEVPAESAASGETSGEAAAEGADAAATPSVYTNLYTNLEKAALLEEIAQYTGVTVVATTNADGTPNIAILTPGAAGDEDHIIFNVAPNTTQENLLRDKVAEMVFDKSNPTAETKEERHQGAVLRLELEEDKAVLDELKANNQYISDATLVCRIAEVMPIG